MSNSMTTRNTLCATLRTLDTKHMTTPEVFEACKARAPDATLDEIIAAMQQLASEKAAEAEALQLYRRCRRAGITGVIDSEPDAA